MRRVAREQREQQAVRSCIGDHQAVGRIAVLADEFEERGEVGRKQQAGSNSTACHHISDDRIDAQTITRTGILWKSKRESAAKSITKVRRRASMNCCLTPA